MNTPKFKEVDIVICDGRKGRIHTVSISEPRKYNIILVKERGVWCGIKENEIEFYDVVESPPYKALS